MRNNMAKIFIKLIAFLLFIFFSSSIASAWALSHYLRSLAHKSFTVGETLVEIPMGSSLRRVSVILFDKKIIDDPAKFFWYLRLGRLDGSKIQAGFYNFDGILSYDKVANRLLFGFDQSFKMTFREGETLVDLARSLENLSLATKEQFIKAMTSPEIIELIEVPHVKGRLQLENDVGGLEGYLFPDTYFFTKSDGAFFIIKKMHQRLLVKLDPRLRLRMADLGLSLHEVLTLAAIVEKETGLVSERPIIASVYHNRLRQKMRLQADPTVIYGMKNYAGKIRKVDLLTFHPYNTYKIGGLPPGPIAAAGLDAIRAVLWPEQTNYLYFVSKNDGSHVFCANLNCHNQAVQKWQVNYFRNAISK
jgi:UPF0755 protein